MACTVSTATTQPCLTPAIDNMEMNGAWPRYNKTLFKKEQAVARLGPRDREVTAPCSRPLCRAVPLFPDTEGPVPLGTYIWKKDHEELTRFISETDAEMKPDDVREGAREGRVCLHVVGGPLEGPSLCRGHLWEAPDGLGGGTVRAKSLGRKDLRVPEKRIGQGTGSSRAGTWSRG